MTHSLSQVHCDAKKLGDQLKQQHLQLVTAESCTGGQLAQTITSVPGASAWFERGFVTYSRLSKQQVLGVNQTLLNQYGSVSKEVVLAMATGALNKSPAHVSIAITGIAGPDGGTASKPIGTVFIACSLKNDTTNFEQFLFQGSRQEVRLRAAEEAINMLLKRLGID